MKYRITGRKIELINKTLNIIIKFENISSSVFALFYGVYVISFVGFCVWNLNTIYSMYQYGLTANGFFVCCFKHKENPFDNSAGLQIRILSGSVQFSRSGSIKKAHGSGS